MGRILPPLFAQLHRAKTVMLHKSCVKAAHAVKAAGQRHVLHRHARVGQQLLGRQQAAGLQILQWRHPQVRFKNTPQMPVAYPQPHRYLGHAGQVRRVGS